MKILVVDDDPFSRRVLRQILATVETGCVVAEASGADEALALVEKPNHGFDVIFLDVSMPDVSGIELLRSFREKPDLRAIPVVLCTASHDRATVNEAAVAGANYYVVKPPTAATIAAKLKQIHAGMAEQNAKA